MMGIRIPCISLFVALLVCWSAGLRAASTSGATAADTLAASPASADSVQKADTSKAAADTAKAVDRFSVNSSSRAGSSMNDVSIGSRMTVNIRPGKGWTLTHEVGIDRKRLRTRKMEDLSESFTNRAEKEQPGLYSLYFDIGETYRKSKSLGLARYGEDIVYDTQEANLAFELTKPIFGASRSVLAITGNGNKGLNDFKYDHTLSGGASGMLNYVFGDILAVGGGAGMNLTRETSDIGALRFGPLRSHGDTLRANMSYGAGQEKTLSVAYSRYNGIMRKVTPPRGNTYEVLNDPSKAKQERITSDGEQLGVQSQIAPFPFLDLSFTFDHSISDQKYAIDTLLSNKTESNSISGSTTYQYAANGRVKFNVSTSDNTSDWSGSLSSYRERKHTVTMGLGQTLGDSISISANGTGSLRQRFYLKQTANPRDADYLSYSGNCSFSAPFRRFTASATASAERYETINIDGTYSGDNRVDYKYQVGPTIMVRPAKWVYLTQDYIVRIEFTDFLYKENENYLNRATTLNTLASFSLFPSLAFSLRHSYLMKDTGSYLTRAEGRRYSPTNNGHENTLTVTTAYTVVPDFTLKAEGNFRIQRNDIFGAQDGRRIVTSSVTYDSGTLRLGFVRKKNFGKLGGIDIDVMYIKNYGPYISSKLKEYVEAEARVNLMF
ncbi:MAG: hypothetical protein PHD74_10275 [Candidatus Krumholzibacteria bacterium]|nr:hypothetical protein [Candidatus Krumholzibacteria bacterium]